MALFSIFGFLSNGQSDQKREGGRGPVLVIIVVLCVSTLPLPLSPLSTAAAIYMYEREEEKYGAGRMSERPSDQFCHAGGRETFSQKMKLCSAAAAKPEARPAYC